MIFIELPIALAPLEDDGIDYANLGIEPPEDDIDFYVVKLNIDLVSMYAPSQDKKYTLIWIGSEESSRAADVTVEQFEMMVRAALDQAEQEKLLMVTQAFIDGD